MTPFQCVIADPPWTYGDSMSAMKSTGNGAASQYNVMDFKAICDLAQFPAGAYKSSYKPHGLASEPGLVLMGQAIADNAHLYCWITNPMLLDGYGHWLFECWGFQLKSMATWVKGRLVVRTRNGKAHTEVEQEEEVIPDLIQHVSQGRYFRGTTEHVLFGVRGTCPALVHNLPNAFVYPSRWKGRLHSEKPPVIHEWAEAMSPGPRIELFARAHRTGWSAVGDQLPIDAPDIITP